MCQVRGGARDGRPVPRPSGNNSTGVSSQRKRLQRGVPRRQPQLRWRVRPEHGRRLLGGASCNLVPSPKQRRGHLRRRQLRNHVLPAPLHAAARAAPPVRDVVTEAASRSTRPPTASPVAPPANATTQTCTSLVAVSRTVSQVARPAPTACLGSAPPVTQMLMGTASPTNGSACPRAFFAALHVPLARPRTTATAWTLLPTRMPPVYIRVRMSVKVVRTPRIPRIRHPTVGTGTQRKRRKGEPRCRFCSSGMRESGSCLRGLCGKPGIFLLPLQDWGLRFNAIGWCFCIASPAPQCLESFTQLCR